MCRVNNIYIFKVRNLKLFMVKKRLIIYIINLILLFSVSVYASDLHDVGFTGQRHDDSTGLISFPYRTYDPNAGRFFQRDPIEYEDGDNLYEYVSGNALSSTDELGLYGEDGLGGIFREFGQRDDRITPGGRAMTAGQMNKEVVIQYFDYYYEDGGFSKGGAILAAYGEYFLGNGLDTISGKDYSGAKLSTRQRVVRGGFFALEYVGLVAGATGVHIFTKSKVPRGAGKMVTGKSAEAKSLSILKKYRSKPERQKRNVRKLNSAIKEGTIEGIEKRWIFKLTLGYYSPLENKIVLNRFFSWYKRGGHHEFQHWADLHRTSTRLRISNRIVSRSFFDARARIAAEIRANIAEGKTVTQAIEHVGKRGKQYGFLESQFPTFPEGATNMQKLRIIHAPFRRVVPSLSD
jgi:RHS repeat-associated protein